MSAPPGYELESITLTVGDDFTLDRSYNDVPSGQAVQQATWTVKRLADIALPDVNAAWQKTISVVDQPGIGQITDTGAASNTAVFRWDAAESETLSLVPGVEYVYDIQVVSTAGKKFTQERGMLVAFAQVTQA